METSDKDQTTRQISRFCPECGQPAGGSNFCPSCGHNMGFTQERKIADTNLHPPSDGGKPRGRAGFVVAGGVLGLAAIAVAVIVLLNNSSSKSNSTATNASSTVAATYKQQVTKAMSPLISANQALSNSLTALNGSKHATTAAKTRTTEALAALSSARGGVTVLTAPAGQSTLSGQVQQALTADNGYLQAVSSTLATPTGSGSGQLQTLATGAQSAFVNLNPVVPSASNSIGGTDTLVNWAQGAQRAAHQAAKKHQAQAAPKASGGSSGGGSSQAPAQSSPAPAQSSPAPSTGCDPGVSVDSATTTCQFANAVFAGYASQMAANGGPLSTTVSASSTTTGQSYEDFCSYDSSSGMVSCSHGTDQIQFSASDAAAFDG